MQIYFCEKEEEKEKKKGQKDDFIKDLAFQNETNYILKENHLYPAYPKLTFKILKHFAYHPFCLC